MGWFNFSKRSAVKQAQLSLPLSVVIRRGMWVMRGQDIGILTDFNPGSGAMEVMFVDPVEGTNLKKELIFDTASLRQAKLAEIPEKRRPTPERGARFGYIE